ncbi:hypothetical protein DKX38_020045 [Salix brachista]|uniref:Uncharacterized protein n=1 Tax=Salix brachista TaxID=2182728 RepID=A0A5N5KI11_9ROSI|nr:hypothetical protein DKX38_020045 [Salix brachista]
MAEQPKQTKDAQRDKTEGEKKKVMLARVLSFLGVQSFAKGLCQVPQFAGLLPRAPPWVNHLASWWTTIGDPYSSFMAGAMVLQSTGHTPFFSKENEDLDTQKREKGVRPHQPPSPEVERV